MIRYGLEWHALDSYFQFVEITAPSTPETNHLRLYAKDSSGTSTLCYKNDAGTEICFPTSGSLVTGTGVSGQVAFWSGTSTLSGDTDLTFTTDTLTATKIIVPTSVTISTMTAGSVVFAGTAGLLSQDNSNLFWDGTNNHLSIGHTDSPDVALDGRGLSIVKANAEASNFSFGTAGLVSGFRGVSARGTVGTPTATQTDDGTFVGFQGHTGSAYTAGKALITLRAGEIFSATNQGSYITFDTTPLASTTRAERFRIGPSGQWGIGGATFGTAGQYFRSGGASAAPTWATIDHGSEVGGLGDDDHTQYFLLVGRAGGQIGIGGTAAADDLTLRATAGAGAGSEAIIFQVGNNGATEGMRITGGTTGRVGIGLTAPSHLVHIRFDNTVGTRALGLEGDGTAANASFETYVGSTAASAFIMRKGRGTVASPTQTLSGDSLGTFVSRAVDSTPALTGDMAKLEAVATENITTTGHGSQWQFSAVPNASTTQVLGLVVGGNGSSPTLLFNESAPKNISGFSGALAEFHLGTNANFALAEGSTFTGGLAGACAFQAYNDAVSANTALEFRTSLAYFPLGGIGVGNSTLVTCLHLEDTDTKIAGVTLHPTGTTPANPGATDEGRIYLKSNKFIFQYNDAGTVRYKYLDLTGTGVTWVHTTTAP